MSGDQNCPTLAGSTEPLMCRLLTPVAVMQQALHQRAGIGREQASRLDQQANGARIQDAIRNTGSAAGSAPSASLFQYLGAHRDLLQKPAFWWLCPHRSLGSPSNSSHGSCLRMSEVAGTGVAEPFAPVERVLGAREFDLAWYGGELPPLAGRYGAHHILDHHDLGRQSCANY